MKQDTNRFCKTGFSCPHSKPQRYFCIAFHRLVTGAPILLVGSLSLFLLVLLVQTAFFRFAPGSTFLTITSANVPTTRLGDPMVLTLCRNVQMTGNIKADAVRTFFRVIEGNKSATEGTYTFKPDIEARNGCQNLTIPPNKYPKKSGTYYMFTSLGFKVHGNYKEVTYQTPPFLISDTKDTLQQQIDAQLHIIRDLQKQQMMENGDIN